MAALIVMPTLRANGKPSIFLLDDPSREKENAKRYTRSEVALAEYSTLVDTIFPVVQSRSLQPGTLEELEKAFRSSHKLVWETAGTYLAALSHYFPQALGRLRHLASDSKASIRLRVVQSQFTATVPEPLLTELLESGLRDTSEQVRTFAASRCGQLRRRDLLHLLEAQAAAEASPTVLESFIYAIHELQA